MRTKLLAGCLFYDTNGKVLLQGREGISRHGEEWSFFGGHIEEDESVEEGVRREIKEELNYDLLDETFLGLIESIDEEVKIIEHVFIAPLPKQELELLEGSEMKLFSIEDALNLKLVPSGKKVLLLMDLELRKIGVLK